MNTAQNSNNVLGRFLFASLVTYIATQAHGWAGGVATPYIFTAFTWFAVILLSLRISSRKMLLALSLGVQLAIHFGSMHSHMHEMNTSNTAMVVGHIVAGVVAWAITVLSEDRFSIFANALSLFKFASPKIDFLKTSHWSLKTYSSDIFKITFGSRAPPVFSSN